MAAAIHRMIYLAQDYIATLVDSGHDAIDKPFIGDDYLTGLVKGDKGSGEMIQTHGYP